VGSKASNAKLQIGNQRQEEGLQSGAGIEITTSIDNARSQTDNERRDLPPNKKGNNMKRVALIGVAALTTIGFAVTGCTEDDSPTGTDGAAGTGTGGATAGGSTGASGCDTTSGTYTEATTFATATKTTPYSMNAYNFGLTNPTSLTQTTTGPTGLDCSAGCAMMTLSFGAGLAQYGAGSQFVQFFGATATDVKNLLNETVTMKIAVTLTPATGATAALPVTVGMFAQDTFTSASGTDNIWTYDLGTPASLDAASGWHTVTYKVIDAHVPSWAATRWVCGSTLHDLGIVIQNNAAITATNAGTVALYVQSVTVAP
jgi:hypothetical protein